MGESCLHQVNRIIYGAIRNEIRRVNPNLDSPFPAERQIGIIMSFLLDNYDDAHQIIKGVLKKILPQATEETLATHSETVYGRMSRQRKAKLNSSLKKISRWMKFTEYLSELLNAAIFIALAFHYFFKDVSNGDQGNNVVSNPAKEARANTWMGGALISGACVNLLHFLIWRHIKAYHIRKAIGIVISVLLVACVVLLLFAAINHGSFWDILSNVGPPIVSSIIIVFQFSLVNLLRGLNPQHVQIEMQPRRRIVPRQDRIAGRLFRR